MGIVEMKKFQFICDLCRTTFEYSEVDSVTGIYWIVDSSFEFRRPNECEKHLCWNCVEEVVRNEKERDNRRVSVT